MYSYVWITVVEIKITFLIRDIMMEKKKRTSFGSSFLN